LARIRPAVEPADVLRPLELATRRRFRFLHLGGGSLEDGTDAVLDAYRTAFSADDDVCLVVSPRRPSKQPDSTVGRLQSDPRGAELLVLDAEARLELERLARACDCLVHAPRSDSLWLE